MEKVIKVIFILLKSSTQVTLMLLSPVSVLLKPNCCTVHFVTGMEISTVIKSLNSEIQFIGSIFFSLHFYLCWQQLIPSPIHLRPNILHFPPPLKIMTDPKTTSSSRQSKFSVIWISNHPKKRLLSITSPLTQ